MLGPTFPRPPRRYGSYRNSAARRVGVRHVAMCSIQDEHGEECREEGRIVLLLALRPRREARPSMDGRL